LSGRGLCDELIARPEEFYRLCCVVVCDLETSRIGAAYILYDINNLRVKSTEVRNNFFRASCWVFAVDAGSGRWRARVTYSYINTSRYLYTSCLQFSYIPHTYDL
jgi:hypothetical protein